MKLEQKIALRYLLAKFRLLSFISKRKAAEEALNLFRSPQKRTKKPLSGVFNEAEKLEFELENISIHGFRWNYPQKSKILIVHGFESSILNFENYIPLLIAKGYEVLAFDAPGHGISGGKTITAPLFAKMIMAIYDKFGPVQSFLAHSFGGLALSLALENMPHDKNSKVVLVAPLTETKTAIDHFFHFLQLNDGVRKEFDRLIAGIGGHPAEWYSIRRAVKNIDANILWLHDKDDQQTPIGDALKVKGENLPHLKFVITKGLGHRRIYREPAVINAIIDFL
ncbi:MAG TPA: alpha/beta fold hydrolase [Chitinophagaceae bacterium]|jgi:pimeloyl-ACP methyl ester carboxylesterase